MSHLAYNIFLKGGMSAVAWHLRKLMNLRRTKIDTWFYRVLNVRRFSFAGFETKQLTNLLPITLLES
jgi:hypothetical protein